MQYLQVEAELSISVGKSRSTHKQLPYHAPRCLLPCLVYIWQPLNHRIPIGETGVILRGNRSRRYYCHPLGSDCHSLGSRRFANRNPIVERDEKCVRVSVEIVTIYAWI